MTRGGKRFEHIPFGEFLEEYIRGAACIVLELDRAAERNVENGDAVLKPEVEIPQHVNMGRPVRVKCLEGGATRYPHDGVDGPVFVGIIKSVEKVEYLSLPTGEGLIIEEEFSNPIARRFQLLASEFVTRLGSPARELKIAILCAAIVPDQIPGNMVEGGAKIVDSVAYYCGEYGRDSLDESDLNVWLTTLRIMAYSKSLRFARYEGFELPFKVHNMMIGAFNF